jgi:phosphate transport system substrate-binding protein
MKKRILMTLTLMVSIAMLAGCGPNNTNSISASGSSALQPLVQKVSDLYKIKNPDISFTINGGGSGVGLKNVSAGTVNIGNSDVYANEKLSATEAATLVDNKVCVVGVGVVVSNDVALNISNITSQQLKDIFSGKITNWKQIESSAPSQPIVIVNRPASSGTRALFVKWGIGGETIAEGDLSLQTDDSNALVETISITKGSIGYLAFSYIYKQENQEKVVPLAIDSVDATNENIYNNTYKIWGYEHMYTKGTPNATVQKFLDFMKSTSVEGTIEELGYGAISKLNEAAASSR